MTLHGTISHRKYRKQIVDALKKIKIITRLKKLKVLTRIRIKRKPKIPQTDIPKTISPKAIPDVVPKVEVKKPERKYLNKLLNVLETIGLIVLWIRRIPISKFPKKILWILIPAIFWAIPLMAYFNIIPDFYHVKNIIVFLTAYEYWRPREYLIFTLFVLLAFDPLISVYGIMRQNKILLILAFIINVFLGVSAFIFRFAGSWAIFTGIMVGSYFLLQMFKMPPKPEYQLDNERGFTKYLDLGAKIQSPKPKIKKEPKKNQKGTK